MMADDLVARLRAGEPCLEANGRPCRVMDAKSGCLCAETAAEIERLRDEINILKSQLEHDAAVIERLQAELDDK